MKKYKVSNKDVYVGNVWGLPRLKRVGNNTRKGTPRKHVYSVVIYGIKYFKVQFHRNDESVIKYFKLKRDAKAYVNRLKDMVTI